MPSWAMVARLLLALLLAMVPLSATVGQHAPRTSPFLPTPGANWSAQVRPPVASSARPQVTSIVIDGDQLRTKVRLSITRPVAADIFTLGEPYRAIIDIDDVVFQLPASAGRKGQGLVSTYRYGQFEGGKSRIVIDLAGPVRIEQAMLVPASGREPARLAFDLVRITAEEFAAMSGGNAARPPPGEPLRAGRHDETTPLRQSVPPEIAPPTPAGPKTRPVIVLDPGHGGIDPGTVAASNLAEKTVVLTVAQHLRNLLQQTGRFDVRMTRQNDSFMSLDQRLKFSRQAGADLFISIHADALAEKELAESVHGASIYTLSDRASNEAARRLAEKENAADVLAGMSSVPASAEDQVRSILLDLVQRETSDFSHEIRSLVAASMRGKIPLARDAQRSAAFKVLKQADTPAVLIELGYMSNAADLTRLSQPEWQRKVAATIATAVESYFSRREKPAPPRTVRRP